MKDFFRLDVLLMGLWIGVCFFVAFVFRHFRPLAVLGGLCAAWIYRDFELMPLLMFATVVWLCIGFMARHPEASNPSYLQNRYDDF